MYYYEVNNEARQIDFVIQRADAVEYDEDDNIEKKLSVSKLFRMYLNQQSDFFTINDISEMLKLGRQSVENFVKQGLLESYHINYFEADLTLSIREKWKQTKRGNFRHIVSKADLKSFLMSNITASFKLTLGASMLPIETDYFKRTPEFLRKNTRYNDTIVFIEHSRTKEEINTLVDDLINKQVVLHSKKTLQQIIEKSDSMMYRLMKVVDSMRLNWGTKKDTTRMIFRVDLDVKKVARERVLITSSYLVAKLKIQLEQELEEREFVEAIDYFAAVTLDAYREAPDGFCNGYFAIERDKLPADSKVLKLNANKDSEDDPE